MGRLRHGRLCSDSHNGEQSNKILNAKLVHSQIIVNTLARCGLPNPQHRRKSGLDMAIQAEQGVACHNLLDRVLASF